MTVPATLAAREPSAPGYDTDLLGSSATQFIFRACLDLLARPGTIRPVLPRSGTEWAASGYPAAAAPLLALSDLMTPLSALSAHSPGEGSPAAVIAGFTRAPLAPLGEARFVLSLGDPDPAELASLNCGTDVSPHAGALLCQAVTSLDGDDAGAQPAPEGAAVRLRLTGPGVKATRSVRVGGLTADFFRERQRLVSAFPRGIDILLISPDGKGLGLPRTTKVEVEQR